MDNNRFEELSQLHFINEISENEKIELENYLLESDEAQNEFNSLKQIHSALTLNRPKPLNDKILDESRNKLLRTLQKEKEQISAKDKFIGFLKDLFAPNYRVVFSGITSLTIGVFLGFLFFSNSDFSDKINPNNTGIDLDKLTESNIDFSNIRFKDPLTNDGEIEFKLNTINPVTYKGKVDDELTLKLLAAALISSDNAGIKLRSLNTLANQKDSNLKPDDKIKKSLITALKTDENAAVRKEALSLLKRYPIDDEIRDAILFTLQNDINSGNRVSAINALSDLQQDGQTIDKTIRKVLNQQAESSKDNFIKIRAASMLQEVK